MPNQVLNYQTPKRPKPSKTWKFIKKNWPYSLLLLLALLFTALISAWTIPGALSPAPAVVADGAPMRRPPEPQAFIPPKVAREERDDDLVWWRTDYFPDGSKKVYYQTRKNWNGVLERIRRENEERAKWTPQTTTGPSPDKR